MEERNERNVNEVKRAKAEIIKTMEDHCQAQMNKLNALKEQLEQKSAWKIPLQTKKQQKALEEIDKCIDLYDSAKKNASEKVEKTLQSKFGNAWTGEYKEDVEKFLNKNKSGVNREEIKKLADHMHNCTSDVARAEDAAMKFMEKKLPITEATQEQINAIKTDFKAESRHFWKKVGLITLATVYLATAVIIGLASHGMLAPVSYKIAAFGLKIAASAVKAAPTAAIVERAIVGGVALAGAAAYQFGGEKKVMFDHMKKEAAKVREDNTAEQQQEGAKNIIRH